jgi:hypothetical protein
VTGTVISGPSFQYGNYKQGVELSFTHVKVKSDQTGKVLDIAMDNVYADGYDYAGESVPDPLTSINVGNRLEVCGESVTGGLKFTHTNCGITPTKTTPNGWVKIIGSNGSVGSNLQESTEYCYLWGN